MTNEASSNRQKCRDFTKCKLYGADDQTDSEVAKECSGWSCGCYCTTKSKEESSTNRTSDGLLHVSMPMS